MRDMFGRDQQTNHKLLKNILNELKTLNERVRKLENEKKESEKAEKKIFSENKMDETTSAMSFENELVEKEETNKKNIYQEQREEELYTNNNYTTPSKNMDQLQQDTLKNIQKNRKEVIKYNITEFVKHNKITTTELKLHIVDTKRYCSKASFYRYMKELSQEKKIGYVSVNEKHYIHILDNELKI